MFEVCNQKGFKEVILLGVTGDRLDHTICNLGIVIKFFNKIKIHISAENSFLSAFNKTVQIKSKINETISLYAFNKQTFITSKGLQYPLQKSNLAFGEKESTSNVSISEMIELKIKGGIVFIIRDFIFMKSMISFSSLDIIVILLFFLVLLTIGFITSKNKE